MKRTLSRRSLFHLSGVGALGCIGGARAFSQQPPDPQLQLPPPPILPREGRSQVSLVKGENRRKLVYDSLMAIEDDLRPALKRKKYVLIKPNLTSVTNQMASTHADTIRGILDFLAPRFKGPIVVAESASGDTMTGYENFKYNDLISEFRSQKVSLVDLNEEAAYVPEGIITRNIHPEKIRIAKRLFDPDAFILCAAIPKTHNAVIVTLAVKNMVLGGALRSGRKEAAWSDKKKFHAGPHAINYNLLLVARSMAPFWGATVLDGYEGMEGDGPVSGYPVPHRIAIASSDFVAADRVATETMGINPSWVGYLQYCGQYAIGNYDIANIDVRGETIASLKRTYRLHPDVDLHLQWMGPIAGPEPI